MFFALTCYGYTPETLKNCLYVTPTTTHTEKKTQSGIKRIGQKFNQTGAEIEISNH